MPFGNKRTQECDGKDGEDQAADDERAQTVRLGPAACTFRHQRGNEATPRFELGNRAFAEPCLTTWLRRRFWSGWRESNPRIDLGKVTGYHYITPAGCERAA